MRKTTYENRADLEAGVFVAKEQVESDSKAVKS